VIKLSGSITVDVARRARQGGHGLHPDGVVDEPREPEVAELGVEGLVQHHVARLHVAVHHALLPLLVEVEQRGSKPMDDSSPHWPCEEGAVAAVEVDVEAAVGHELVDEEQLVAAAAPAHELHEIPVAEPADRLDLGRVLLPPLNGGSFSESLNGHGEAVAVLLLQVAPDPGTRSRSLLA
jgi:hypothetical protein